MPDLFLQVYFKCFVGGRSVNVFIIATESCNNNNDDNDDDDRITLIAGARAIA